MRERGRCSRTKSFHRLRLTCQSINAVNMRSRIGRGLLRNAYHAASESQACHRVRTTRATAGAGVASSRHLALDHILVLRHLCEVFAWESCRCRKDKPELDVDGWGQCFPNCRPSRTPVRGDVKAQRRRRTRTREPPQWVLRSGTAISGCRSPWLGSLWAV